MLFLVICRPVPDGDQAEFRRLVADEGAALRKLKADGVLTGAWSPGGPGAVLMLDLPDLPAAQHLAAGFPLAGAGLITAEVIPLQPINL